jgi:hypothetical protein
MGDLVLFYPRCCTNSDTNWTLSVMCFQQFSPRLVRRSFADMQSQVRGLTGARLGGVPIGWNFRFGGSDQTSLWHIRDVVVHMYILPVSWQTQDVRMSHPSLMVLWERWTGKRFCIITNCILIVQTPYLSSIGSISLPVMLILKGQWGWFWRKSQLWGFLYLLTCHPVLLSDKMKDPIPLDTLFVGDVLIHN